MINNVDKYLGIANKAKEEYGLKEDYCALISMLKELNGELYVIVPFTKSDAKVWSKEISIVPEYWCMINILNNEVIEFNKTSEKGFNNQEIKENSSDDSFNKEISKYVVKTKMKYKEYIENDIKNNELLTYQKEISKLVEDLNLNDEKVSFNDYFYANFEEGLNNKIDELIDLIAATKYNSLTTYYDVLFTNIINEYLDKKSINQEKIQLACNMMNSYYQGINGLDNIFEM